LFSGFISRIVINRVTFGNKCVEHLIPRRSAVLPLDPRPEETLLAHAQILMEKNILSIVDICSASSVFEDEIAFRAKQSGFGWKLSA
ncbi:MAG: hypothetical protein AAF311_15310, partial [Pseudomonadota bacterium]